MVAEASRADGEFVRVDRFFNHRIEPEVVAAVVDELATVAATIPHDLIVTAEASGLIPAVALSLATSVPVVFAKKVASDVRTGLTRVVHSPTKGSDTALWIDPILLEGSTDALIVDDFLASGSTAIALCGMLGDAGISIAGVLAVFEKPHQGARTRLGDLGVRVESLVRFERVGSGYEAADDATRVPVGVHA